jgi:hypothetical protein
MTGSTPAVAHECDATRVRIVHIVPAANDGYRSSLNRDSQRAAGDDVLSVWRRLLRQQTDFVSVGSARFTDPELAWTSPASATVTERREHRARR